MTKYHSAGWLGQAEVTAVSVAQLGYSGDTSVLDGDYGFWKAIGSRGWEPDKVIENMGQSWLFPQNQYYKFYACCYVMQMREFTP